MKTNLNPLKLTIIVFICIILILNIISFLVYQSGGKRGYSLSLEESKARKVFIKELSYEAFPKELKINAEYVFYIERGFCYGMFSIFETQPIPLKNKNPYQLVFGCKKPCEPFKACDFNCKEKKYNVRETIILLHNSSAEQLILNDNFLRDTVYYDIIYSKFSSFKTDTIGYIKVWDKN